MMLGASSMFHTTAQRPAVNNASVDDPLVSSSQWTSSPDFSSKATGLNQRESQGADARLCFSFLGSDVDDPRSTGSADSIVRPRLGSTGSANSIVRPRLGSTGSANFIARPRLGSIGSADFIARPRLGSIGSADFIARPRLGSIGSADFIARPRLGSIGSADFIARPRLGSIGSAYSIERPRLGSTGSANSIERPRLGRRRSNSDSKIEWQSCGSDKESVRSSSQSGFSVSFAYGKWQGHAADEPLSSFHPTSVFDEKLLKEMEDIQDPFSIHISAKIDESSFWGRLKEIWNVLWLRYGHSDIPDYLPVAKLHQVFFNLLKRGGRGNGYLMSLDAFHRTIRRFSFFSTPFLWLDRSNIQDKKFQFFRRFCDVLSYQEKETKSSTDNTILKVHQSSLCSFMVYPHVGRNILSDFLLSPSYVRAILCQSATSLPVVFEPLFLEISLQQVIDSPFSLTNITHTHHYLHTSCEVGLGLLNYATDLLAVLIGRTALEATASNGEESDRVKDSKTKVDFLKESIQDPRSFIASTILQQSNGALESNILKIFSILPQIARIANYTVALRRRIENEVSVADVLTLRQDLCMSLVGISESVRITAVRRLQHVTRAYCEEFLLNQLAELDQYFGFEGRVMTMRGFGSLMYHGLQSVRGAEYLIDVVSKTPVVSLYFLTDCDQGGDLFYCVKDSTHGDKLIQEVIHLSPGLQDQDVLQAIESVVIKYLNVSQEHERASYPKDKTSQYYSHRRFMPDEEVKNPQKSTVINYVDHVSTKISCFILEAYQRHIDFNHISYLGLTGWHHSPPVRHLLVSLDEVRDVLHGSEPPAVAERNDFHFERLRHFMSLKSVMSGLGSVLDITDGDIASSILDPIVAGCAQGCMNPLVSKSYPIFAHFLAYEAFHLEDDNLSEFYHFQEQEHMDVLIQKIFPEDAQGRKNLLEVLTGLRDEAVCSKKQYKVLADQARRAVSEREHTELGSDFSKNMEKVKQLYWGDTCNSNYVQDADSQNKDSDIMRRCANLSGHYSHVIKKSSRVIDHCRKHFKRLGSSISENAVVIALMEKNRGDLGKKLENLSEQFNPVISESVMEMTVMCLSHTESLMQQLSDLMDGKKMAILPFESMLTYGVVRTDGYSLHSWQTFWQNGVGHLVHLGDRLNNAAIKILKKQSTSITESDKNRQRMQDDIYVLETSAQLLYKRQQGYEKIGSLLMYHSQPSSDILQSDAQQDDDLLSCSGMVRILGEQRHSHEDTLKSLLWLNDVRNSDGDLGDDLKRDESFSDPVLLEENAPVDSTLSDALEGDKRTASAFAYYEFMSENVASCSKFMPALSNFVEQLPEIFNLMRRAMRILEEEAVKYNAAYKTKERWKFLSYLMHLTLFLAENCLILFDYAPFVDQVMGIRDDKPAIDYRSVQSIVEHLHNVLKRLTDTWELDALSLNRVEGRIRCILKQKGIIDSFYLDLLVDFDALEAGARFVLNEMRQARVD